jgi:hypothetical protein
MPYNDIKHIAFYRRCGDAMVVVQSSEDDTHNVINCLRDPEAFVTLVNAMIRRSAVTLIDEESLKK